MRAPTYTFVNNFNIPTHTTDAYNDKNALFDNDDPTPSFINKDHCSLTDDDHRSFATVDRNSHHHTSPDNDNDNSSFDNNNSSSSSPYSSIDDDEDNHS